MKKLRLITSLTGSALALSSVLAIVTSLATPAGAQVPQMVLDAVNFHLIDHNVQRGGRYPQSIAVDDTIARARASTNSGAPSLLFANTIGVSKDASKYNQSRRSSDQIRPMVCGDDLCAASYSA